MNADGSRLNFTHWFPWSARVRDQCAYMSVLQEGYWHTAQCSESRLYFCEYGTRVRCIYIKVLRNVLSDQENDEFEQTLGRINNVRSKHYRFRVTISTSNKGSFSDIQVTACLQRGPNFKPIGKVPSLTSNVD